MDWLWRVKEMEGLRMVSMYQMTFLRQAKGDMDRPFIDKCVWSSEKRSR